MGNPTVTAIIPCNNSRFLRQTVRSLQTQTVRPERIVVVADGIPLTPIEGVEILQNKTNRGKSYSVNRALKTVTTEYTFCGDADTTFAPNCVERLVNGITGKVVITTARVFAANTRTWVGKARSQDYRLWFANGKTVLINGCAYLGRTRTLRRYPLSSKTMTEDERLGYKVERSRKKFALIPSARCYTHEPENGRALLRQFVRWRYGALQQKPTWALIGLYGITGMLAFLTALTVYLFYLNVFGWLFLILEIGIVWGTYTYMVVDGSLTLRRMGLKVFLRYRMICDLAGVVACARFVIRAKPSW